MIITSAYRVLLVLYIFTSLIFITKDYFSKNSTIVFTKGSFLKIKGQTNVSSFECKFDMQTLSDSMQINYSAHNQLLKFHKTKLTLPNMQFDCGGRGINKDFHKLLNTKEFPKINIILREVSASDEVKNQVNAIVEIIISNISNTYTIPIDIDQKDNLILSGVLPVNINDYNLQAPKKILGIIKVSPIIEIAFSLKVKYS